MKKLEHMTELELRALMNTLASQVVASAVTCGVEKPLFVLLLFNDPKVSQYVANANRQDVVKALREAADRLEAREDVTR